MAQGRVYPLMSAIADFTAGPPNLPGFSSVSLLQGATTLRGWSVQQGRQYELGNASAGTCTLDLTDSLEYLNPASTTSPWNTGGNSLLPYRCMQLGAWWNGSTKDTTGNLLNSTNAAPGFVFNAYDPSFETSFSFVGILAGAPTYALSTTQHFAGAKSLAITFTATADKSWIAMLVAPGYTYTLSVYVYVPAGVTVTATFSNQSNLAGAIASATSTVSGAWQRLTMTGVPSGPMAGFTIKQTTGAFPQTVYVDAIQLELGSTASAFTTSGPTYYPIYTGYVERYPQKWDAAGFRGIKTLAAVDALSPLSRIVIRQSYAATVLADGPAVYIPYNDNALPQAVQRPAGGQQMVGYQQLGSQSASVNFGGDTFPDGSKAVSVVQQNTSPVTFFDNTQMTYIGTRQGGLTMNPQSFTLEGWVRFTVGVAYIGFASMQAGETTVGSVTGTLYWLGLYTTNGTLCMAYFDPNGSTSFIINTSTVGGFWYPDGQWHYMRIVMLGSNTFQFQRDGLTSTVRTFNTTPSLAVGLNNFFAEAQTYYGDPISNISVANFAAYGSAISTNQALAHYQRGIGYLGEKSGTRAQRLLTKYWSSNIIVDTGKTSMAADFSYNGRRLLAVLEEIADTEGGLVWADAAGFVHQDSRETRYINAKTSLFTFGENVAGGELPYVDLAYDNDPTYVYSEADLTSGTGVALPPVVNATSQTAYGQRILAKTMQMANDWDVDQAGRFFVQRYRKPAGLAGSGVPPRISKLTIDPASNPNLWTAALSLDIGNRVTVKRRTNAAAGVTISGDYYIEQISHHAGGDASTWLVDFQLSPVFVPRVWKLGDASDGVLGSTTVCVY